MNLTALSHCYNLYIVACEDELHVYQPQFPDQKLTSEAALVIPLPSSRSGLPGNFHNSNPHAVNHIIVADLGREEIVLCACDDGDVVGYWTRTINNAVMKAQEEGAVTSEDFRPMFHQNVHESAWGLAVHKESRQIAVSANSTEITVFKFALAEEDEERSELLGEGRLTKHGGGAVITRQLLGTSQNHKSLAEESTIAEESEEQHDHEEWGNPNPTKPHDRSRNTRVELYGIHATNIPCIAFCNTPEDPGGEYLISTDIKGLTVLWDIKSEGDFTQCLVPNASAVLNRRHDYDERRAGWGLMFLDKRAFLKTSSIKQAMGNGTASLQHHDKTIADISRSKDSVRNAGAWAVQDGTRERRHMTPEPGIDDEAVLRIERAGLDDLETDTPPPFSDPSTGASTPNHLQHRDLTSLPISDLAGIANAHSWPILTYSTQVSSVSSGFTLPTQARPSVPTCPLLLISPQTVHLLQSANFDSPAAYRPVVFLDDPLAQEIDNLWRAFLDDLDRMNFSAVIPELGVVLLGSPKGRVAVLTLHLLEDRPTTSARDTANHNAKLPRPAYTMRLDHLLPFSTQEKAGLRPPQVLVGLAAGPVQGCLGRDDERREERRRWRVMLLYRDHTVLSYEIGRSTGMGRVEVLV